MYVLRDHLSREETPAVTEEGRKFDSGKARYELIPPKPLSELVHVFTLGAEKYGDRNWERGIAFGRIFSAMMRHAWAWWRGEQRDPDDGQHHLASVAWAALCLMELEETRPAFDDRPKVADGSEKMTELIRSSGLEGDL